MIEYATVTDNPPALIALRQLCYSSYTKSTLGPSDCLGQLSHNPSHLDLMTKRKIFLGISYLSLNNGKSFELHIIKYLTMYIILDLDCKN